MLTNAEPAKPLITTVIPTYRRPQLLRRAVKSVLCQTYPYFRVCIYDNASGDETAAVVAELAKGDPRVQYYSHSKNIGLVRNFLHGMERVETPYFSFLSDDDILLPDFYQRALEGFQKFPEAAFSALSTIVMILRDRIAVVGGGGWQEGLYRPPEGLRKMLEFWPPGWTGVVFRRELIDQIGPLDTEVGHALDLDYLYRVAAHFPIAVSLQPGALWVAHAASASVESPLDGVWPGWLKMIQNLTDNQEIPLEVKELATRKLTARLKRLLFTDSGWLAVLGGRCEEAQRSAEILKQHFREERKAALLRFLVRIQLAFSPFGKLVLMMLAGRRKLREIWNADYRRQRIPYLAYVKYLDLT